MNMIEKVARSIHAQLEKEMQGYGYISDIGDDMTDVVVDGRVDLLAVARAAIEAMREPSGEVEYAMDRMLNAPPHGGIGS